MRKIIQFFILILITTMLYNSQRSIPVHGTKVEVDNSYKYTNNKYYKVTKYQIIE